MNIGIVVFSLTGNTLHVGKHIKESLDKKGHQVVLERILVNPEAKPGAKEFKIINAPEVKDYDLLIIGSPVHAFSLSLPMASYLSTLENVEGKKVACYVTKHLPYFWTGGKRALKQMREACEKKGAQAYAQGIIPWNSKDREQNIEKLIQEIAAVL